MTVYLVLLGVLFLICAICMTSIKNENKQKSVILSVVLFLLYLLCVLRSSEVGLDTIGYKEIYEKTSTVPFGDFSYVYFEISYKQYFFNWLTIKRLAICISLRLFESLINDRFSQP